MRNCAIFVRHTDRLDWDTSPCYPTHSNATIMLSSSCDFVRVSSSDTSTCSHHAGEHSSTKMCNADLPFQKEDFGRPNHRFRMRFLSTFQLLVAQIEYSRPLKVLRQRIVKQTHILMLSSDFDKQAFLVILCSPNDDFMLPKRRFWKAEPTFQKAFSKHFSRVWALDLGYKPLKSASKTPSEMLARPSKIFVWEG